MKTVIDIFTKQPRQCVPWDNILSMADGRGWYACPVCGGGISGPLNGPLMAHEECLKAAA